MLTATKKAVIDPLKRAKGRLVVAGAIFVIAFTAIGFRLADLTILGSQYVRQAALGQAVEQATDRHFRANILDRNGEILATSLKTTSLYADPARLRNADQAVNQLVKIFPDLGKERLLQQLSNPQRRFVWIKRGLTPEQEYQINRMGIPGLEFEEELTRFYPHGSILSHIVGYTDVDSNGLSGLEKSREDDLRHQDIRLSIDVRLQYFLHNAMKKTVAEFNAIGAAGVMIDVHNGEILAMVSLPDFDPHHPTRTPAETRFNKATLGVFELGSTFKLLSAAAALEGNHIKISDRFDCREPFKFGRHTIRDFHPQKRVMSFPEVFMHSSNIGYAQMAQKLGTNHMKDFYNRLGLFESPEIELPERGRPLLPNPWRDINTITASYGHGIAITPLQMASATASIVNGGFKVTPTLMKQNAEKFKKGERILSKNTSDKMRELMRLVVSEGTGGRSEFRGYMVGGKTGTAEKLTARGYDRTRRISSFVAAYPMNDPRYAIFVMVDEPKGIQRTFGYATGGWVAAPVIAEMVRKGAPLLGLEPLSEDAVVQFDDAMSINAVPRKRGDDVL